jgi:hypothetical protein
MCIKIYRYINMLLTFRFYCKYHFDFIRFTIRYLPLEAYEYAFREAGFENLEWRKMIIAENATPKDKEFVQDYTHLICFIAW